MAPKHDAMPAGIWPHNPLSPRHRNGHTRHTLSIQSLARPQFSIGYCYPSCPHNANLQGSFPASLCQWSRNESSCWPHLHWLAWGHQGGPPSLLSILATQRDPHHWGWSSPARWSTHHSSCQKGERVLHQLHQFHQGITKSQLLMHGSFFWPSINKAIKEVSLPVWNLHTIPESESCSTPHTYTHTISPMADVCPRHLHTWRSWPPGSGQHLLEDDLCSTYSTWPEQHQQSCLTAEGGVFQSMVSPKSFTLTMAHNMQVPSFVDFCISWGITHETSSLHYPQSNGFAEACVKSIKHTLQWAKYSSANPHLTLPSTPSYTHWHQASISSRAVVPMPTQNNHSSQDMQQQPISHTCPMSRFTLALKLLIHRVTNITKHLCHCMLVNRLQCMTPSERFGFLLLWYMSTYGRAIKYAPAMVPHTTTCRDTFMNAVSKQLTLSQVAQLPHCRLWLDTTFQWYNIHCHNLHSICSPHPLHLQHQQPRWTRLQLFLPHQLFKGMPWCQCLWHPMPLLYSHKDPAVPCMAPRCLIQEI